MREFRVTTQKRSQLVDITELVRSALGELDGAGAALVYVPHTTAGVTINEHADPPWRATSRSRSSGSSPRTGRGSTSRRARRTHRPHPAVHGLAVVIPVRDGTPRARHLAGDLLLRVRRPQRALGLRDGAHDRGRRPQQALREDAGGRRAQLPRRAGHDHRFSRPERRRQVDDLRSVLGLVHRTPAARPSSASLPGARPAVAPGRAVLEASRGARAGTGGTICASRRPPPACRRRASTRCSRSSI